MSMLARIGRAVRSRAPGRRALRRHAVAIALAVIAVVIAWSYAATTLRATPELGLPLDDSYIYFTYAKQLGRGAPFTYVPGGGYSAGATSVTWPVVLAPLWTLGARGHALVWAAFVLCAGLYAACAVLVARIVRRVTRAPHRGDVPAPASSPAARTPASPSSASPASPASPSSASPASPSTASPASPSSASTASASPASPSSASTASASPASPALASTSAPSPSSSPSAGLHSVLGEAPGAVAALAALSIAAFAWTALSGMEVAITSALLLGVVALLLARAPAGAAAPSRALRVTLVALALARPEAAVIAAAICLVHAVVHRRDRRAALRWLVPVLAPVLWLVVNRVLAGHWMPSTAIAKSQWFQPGFTWGAWASALATNAGKLVRGLFWEAHSPLPQARVFALVWLVGCVRLVAWARGHGASARVAVAVIVGAPIAWCAMVLAASGLWTLHQFRYIAPMFPLLAVPIGVAIAPLARRPATRWATLGLGAVIAIAVAWLGVVRHRASAAVFAQGAADTNAQVVKLGRYIRERVPGARVLLHDAGALAYYSDAQVIDMLGLVTDETAGIAAHGPGARFEYLESLPAEARPTHLAYYPGWLGAPDFIGRLVTDAPLGPQFARERVVGGKNLELSEASWDHAGTGERPLVERAGWSVVDRVDVADLASERAHAWDGALGVRAFADPTTRWSFVARDVGEAGLVIDGGRTIRGGREAFTIARDPRTPARLVLRTGGAASADQEPITRPVSLRIAVDGAPAGELVVPPSTGRMVEVELALPAGGTRVTVTAGSPYRAFHWFVLQPIVGP